MKNDQENKNVPSADAEFDLEKDGDKVTGGDFFGGTSLIIYVGVVLNPLKTDDAS